MNRAIDKKPEKTVLHIGTNDLQSTLSPEQIGGTIMSMGKHISENNISPVISGLIPRGDKHDDKRGKVNKILKTSCLNKNFSYIDHGNIDKMIHLNNSLLHVNKVGNSILSRNISTILKPN